MVLIVIRVKFSACANTINWASLDDLIHFSDLRPFLQGRQLLWLVFAFLYTKSLLWRGLFYVRKYSHEFRSFQCRSLYRKAAFWHTVFDLITAHTPISAQSGNSVVFKFRLWNKLFRLQPVYFLSTFCKGVWCGHSFELHRFVDAIQMSTPQHMHL